MADGTVSLGKPTAPVEPLNRGHVCWYFGQPCSTADDIAAPMRRNETRSLSLMSAIAVDSATAQPGSWRSPTNEGGSDEAILLFAAIARKAVAIVGIYTCGTY